MSYTTTQAEALREDLKKWPEIALQAAARNSTVPHVKDLVLAEIARRGELNLKEKVK